MENLRAISPSSNPIIDNKERIENSIFEILELVGEDPNREGLLETPHRVAKMFSELFQGYYQDLKVIVNGALYDAEEGTDEMIIVDSIDYSSMCEHHMLPFTGRAHIAYLPGKMIIGLSKIPRIVDMFSRRLQVQERLTSDIARSIDEVLKPRGVAIVLTGVHSCASLRGVKKHGINMKTMEFTGEFKTDKDLKREFYQLINTR